MGHLCFVVPFISKQIAKDWEFQNVLLHRTVASLLNQEHENFSAVVVGHDQPTFPLSDDRIHWLPVDFPLEISDRDPMETASRDLEIKWTDRGRKLYYGTEVARQLGATHILPVDSDDLVSRRLAGIVAQSPERSGWIFWSGYRYYEGEDCVQLKARRFFEECGTGAILKIADTPIPAEPEYDRGYTYYRFLLNHAYIERKMNDARCAVARLPFPAAVYVIHSCNFYARGRQQAVWGRIKDWATRRRLNEDKIREFGSFALAR